MGEQIVEASEPDSNAIVADSSEGQAPIVENDCPEHDWNDLRRSHPVELVNELRLRFFEPGGPIELTADQLLADLNVSADLEAAAGNLLLEVFGPGELRCFCVTC